MVKKFNAKFRVGQGGLIEVSSDVTLAEGEDQVVLVDASGGPVTVTLQRADGSGGKRFCIKKIDASGNSVTIEPKAGQTIDGGVSESLPTQNDFIDIVSDNENWQVIGATSTPGPSAQASLQMVSYKTDPVADLEFFTIAGAKENGSLTELDQQCPVARAITFKNMTLAVNTNTQLGSSTFKLRISGVNGNQVITIGAGLTGIFRDVTNSDDILASDLVAYQIDKFDANVLNITGSAIEEEPT